MDIAVVRGDDGKVLGVTYDEGCLLDRDDYDEWDDFLSAFARLAFSRVPTDGESDHAKRLLAKDNERLKELHRPLL